MQAEVYIFIIFILNGILIGLIFDCFRVFRKSFKTPDFATYIQDIIFGILTGLLLLYSIMKFNNGEIRLHLFLGIFLGILLYLFAFSKTFIKISVCIISIIKKLVNWLIIIPIKYIVKFLKKIIFKPIVFVCINVRNKIKKVSIFSLKIKKKKFKNNET